MRAAQPSTHAAQTFFMPMGEKVIGRLRPVPRTVSVRSIGLLSAPFESGGDSDLMLANATCCGTGVAGFSFGSAAAACSSAFGTDC